MGPAGPSVRHVGRQPNTTQRSRRLRLPVSNAPDRFYDVDRHLSIGTARSKASYDLSRSAGREPLFTKKAPGDSQFIDPDRKDVVGRRTPTVDISKLSGRRTRSPTPVDQFYDAEVPTHVPTVNFDLLSARKPKVEPAVDKFYDPPTLTHVPGVDLDRLSARKERTPSPALDKFYEGERYTTRHTPSVDMARLTTRDRSPSPLRASGALDKFYEASLPAHLPNFDMHKQSSRPDRTRRAVDVFYEGDKVQGHKGTLEMDKQERRERGVPALKQGGVDVVYDLEASHSATLPRTKGVLAFDSVTARESRVLHMRNTQPLDKIYDAKMAQSGGTLDFGKRPMRDSDSFLKMKSSSPDVMYEVNDRRRSSVVEWEKLTGRKSSKKRSPSPDVFYDVSYNQTDPYRGGFTFSTVDE